MQSTGGSDHGFKSLVLLRNNYKLSSIKDL